MEAERLSAMMGIPLRKMIGKYLGHTIVQDGNSRERHKEMLQRIYSRVDGWKLNSLSKAGRITLTQSVMGSMPIYSMHERLPSWVHKELNIVTRRCVWGTSKESRVYTYLVGMSLLGQRGWVV